MSFKIVEVHWLDAQSSMKNLTIKEALKELKPILTKSVGYLIDDSKEEYLLLAFTDFGQGQFKHWQLIPKGMIKGNPKVIKH